MPIKSREYTVAEILAESEETNRLRGRTNCPYIATLKAHPEWSIDDYEMWLFNHPDFLAPVACDVIATCGRSNTPEVTAEIQVLYASELVKCDWSRACAHVEALLHTPDIPHGICPEAMSILSAWFVANHHNPLGFFAQHHPARHLASAR